jgi:hypothetical protein
MKLRISKTLKFWLDVAYEQRIARSHLKNRQSLVAEVLQEFEKAGEAMRYLSRDGRIAWKATPKMLDRLAAAERDAKDELGEWP